MKNRAAQQLGKLGGEKTAEIYGSDHFKKANMARKTRKGWPKGKKRKI